MNDLVNQSTIIANSTDEESKRNYFAWREERELNLRNQEALARQRHEQVVNYTLDYTLGSLE